jgi:DCN1-like protein 1/2
MTGTDVAYTTDPNGDNIGIDGTIKWCSDLGVDPEDVSLLAVACELKSPTVGEWTKSGFVDGWKRLGCVFLFSAYIMAF